jgi:CheY-like chemotaxis protein/CHASE3 domain sensor protein
MPYRRRAKSSRLRTNLPLALGLAAMIVFFLGSGLVSYRNSKFLADDAEMVAHTHEVITSLELIISMMKDAETGQRGFVITGDERYLQPYLSAKAGIDQTVARVESLTADNPDHIAQIAPVKQHIHAKFAELEETINLRRTQGFEAARDIVVTDRGRTEMDLLRAKVSEMEKAEYVLREKRLAAMKDAYRVAIIGGILTALLGVALAIAAAYLVERSLSMRRRQDWLSAGRLGLGAAISGDKRLEQLGESVLGYLAKYLDAHAGAFYTRQGDDFRRSATYGVPAESETPERFKIGEGLLGQAAVENSTILINDVPDGYLKIGSSLGQSKPRQLIISAASSDNTVNAVLELGFIHPLDELGLELLKQAAESIGVAVRSANYRSNLQEFLEETQRQAEELQAQSEELRVSNEELEEQSRALKESQSRLEQQQAELEQTNSQLEEQTQQLENQRNDLTRANLTVEAKAEELQRASRYKSDFLANMSHELRTPLNSSLILSKLLSDNPEGNLTQEQVRYAQTIQSSGNDLLALINDILDLSKIEAGHMEVRPETLPLSRISGDLTRMFEPLGKQKNLPFVLTIQPGCPEFIETDRQRLEQILKNLLSNAFKFTESGRVELVIGRESDGLLSFAVTDTGIGISEEHQRDIFEAFRQADGTISRKYGGTGLGLSISRELARLLGGAIRLHSKPGQGSTFTLVLPETFGSGASVDSMHKHEPAKPAVPVTEVPVNVAHYIRDDREQLAADSRTILVVEDDETFARILYDLAHEMDFRCLIATTAEDALAIARQYLPNAVILDVGLPDNSGLLVLDRLKRDTRTRHIPIHVVSAGDYSQTAYSLGAMGYMLKPVKREDIVGALKQIETRLGNDKRRVLIVEDDAVQRESLMRLLGSGSVETVAVGTASECLDTLKESTYDCMVLDLSLPDASGYSLLETLSQQDAYSFPPVIVYTGRDLSSDEEQRLRRYSKSIIIKGAKSPERLLDEVTLFLHRVVSELPPEHQRMLQKAHNRDAILEGRRILVVEDDVRNVYALTNIFEPRGAIIQIARNGLEALDALEKTRAGAEPIDLVLMDVMMPEMDGMTATREIRKQQEWRKLPVIMLTAKAMKNDQERCLDAGANDYMAKPIDVEKLLSLVRVWMPR